MVTDDEAIALANEQWHQRGGSGDLFKAVTPKVTLRKEGGYRMIPVARRGDDGDPLFQLTAKIIVLKVMQATRVQLCTTGRW
jgi:hypothetical protein